ncbi:MAG TPA: hypothetical protein VKA08_14590, partial [Balneolales bacterium]|nr:hypothetical protein [Balneolales bacterium]
YYMIVPNFYALYFVCSLHNQSYIKMKRALHYFFGFLFGSMIYYGLIQYSDKGHINFRTLFLDPRHWFIATFVGLGVIALKRLREKKNDPKQ